MTPYLFRWHRQWVGGQGPLGPVVRPLLRLCSWAYGFGVLGRLLLYRGGLKRRHRSAARIISVGNLTAGGTGKTPMVILLSRELKQRGLQVAVVSRGYGGAGGGGLLVVSDGAEIRETYPRVGDEPLLLARKLPGVPVIIAADRRAGCEFAIAEFGAEAILLDDGFQHLQVERDLDLLLFDGANPFGYGYLLPRGLLREPLFAMRRADLLIITTPNPGGNFPELERVLKGYASVPILRAVYTPTGCTDLRSGETIPWERLQDRKVVAFSGIANPVGFEKTLRAAGIQPCQHLSFPDHHPYGPEDLGQIRRAMEEHGATMAFTTEKDAVRLEGLPLDFPVAAFGVKLSLEAGWDELERSFDALFARGER